MSSIRDALGKQPHHEPDPSGPRRHGHAGIPPPRRYGLGPLWFALVALVLLAAAVAAVISQRQAIGQYLLGESGVVAAATCTPLPPPVQPTPTARPYAPPTLTPTATPVPTSAVASAASSPTAAEQLLLEVARLRRELAQLRVASAPRPTHTPQAISSSTLAQQLLLEVAQLRQELVQLRADSAPRPTHTPLVLSSPTPVETTALPAQTPAERTLPPFRVEATASAGGGLIAMIDGEIYQVGDVVAGHRILAIGRNWVQCEGYEGRIYVKAPSQTNPRSKPPGYAK